MSRDASVLPESAAACDRRDFMRMLGRGLLLAGLGAMGWRAATGRAARVPRAQRICTHACNGCARRTVCTEMEAARARKERRHGT